MPGYGWVFPLGDGTVNVGVGLLSTFSRWKSVNTTDMMRDYVATAPDYWELSEESKLSEPREASMSLSVGPRVGRNWVVVGGAAGAINPWNGEGISYGYETGRLAAHHISQALQRDDLTLLPRYEQSLDEEYGLYFKMARTFVKAIGNPWVMRTLARGAQQQAADGVDAQGHDQPARRGREGDRRAGLRDAGRTGEGGTDRLGRRATGPTWETWSNHARSTCTGTCRPVVVHDPDVLHTGIRGTGKMGGEHHLISVGGYPGSDELKLASVRSTRSSSKTVKR